MTVVLEERVTRLEMRMERLETWAGPGQNVSFSESLAELRKRFDDFGRVQAKHTKMISDLADDVASLEAAFNSDVAVLKTDTATLKIDMVGIKTDVATLKTDMAGVKTDVATLKTDVTGLKADMVEVKGTLGEILDRLPPRRG